MCYHIAYESLRLVRDPGINLGTGARPIKDEQTDRFQLPIDLGRNRVG